MSFKKDARAKWPEVFSCTGWVCFRFTVNEVIDMLEDDDLFQRADIFLDPPEVDELTDEDSGEEDGECAVHNLSGRQLTASATATIVGLSGRTTLGEENSGGDGYGQNQAIDYHAQ